LVAPAVKANGTVTWSVSGLPQNAGTAVVVTPKAQNAIRVVSFLFIFSFHMDVVRDRARAGPAGCDREFSKRGNDSPQNEERFNRFDNTDLLSKNGGCNDSTQCSRHS
jgi:hypothetical protein